MACRNHYTAWCTCYSNTSPMRCNHGSVPSVCAICSNERLQRDYDDMTIAFHHAMDWKHKLEGQIADQSARLAAKIQDCIRLERFLDETTDTNNELENENCDLRAEIDEMRDRLSQIQSLTEA